MDVQVRVVLEDVGFGGAAWHRSVLEGRVAVVGVLQLPNKQRPEQSALVLKWHDENETERLFVSLLKAYSPANRTVSPRGFYRTCTLHKHKTYKHNPTVSPLGIAVITKMAMKLGDAGIINHFALAFQYQI